VANATRTLQTELEVRRDSEEWWINRYRSLLLDQARYRSPVEGNAPPRAQVRVAVARNLRLDSQGLSDGSQTSSSTLSRESTLSPGGSSRTQSQREN